MNKLLCLQHSRIVAVQKSLLLHNPYVREINCAYRGQNLDTKGVGNESIFVFAIA